MTEKLFLTDGEIAERLGIPTKELVGTLIVLERSGFPPKDIQFGNRRYWPAVRNWLDTRYRLVASSAPGNPARNGDGKWQSKMHQA
jgi:hypothetical protein